MSGLAPDEKACPFCAEVIKAAAIKCRYCGSDLPADAAPPADDDRPEETRRPEETGEAGQPAGAAAVPQAGPTTRSAWYARRGLTVVLAIVLVATVIGTVLAGRHAWNSSTPPDGQITSESTRAVLMDEASNAVEKVLSFHAKTFAKDSAAAQDLMTASMKAQYLKTLDKVRKKVSKYGVNLTAKVLAIGLVSATSSHVEALVFFNQSTTARDSKNTQLDEVRAVVTMDHTAGGWRVSDIQPLKQK